MARNKKADSVSVVVIGLGRFGVAVAESLVRMGQEVLAIDEDPELVERWADELTHVVRADTTDDAENASPLGTYGALGFRAGTARGGEPEPTTERVS